MISAIACKTHPEVDTFGEPVPSVLAVTSELPWPLNTGGHLRTFHLLAAEYKGVIFLRSLNQETRDNPTTLNMFVP